MSGPAAVSAVRALHNSGSLAFSRAAKLGGLPGAFFRRAAGEEVTTRQGQADPAVLAAFVLDLADAERADLARAADVRTAACLQVDALDLDQAHPSRAGRRPHRHGAYQLRARIEFGGIDPHEADRPVLGDPARHALSDLVLVDRGALEVEVEPAPVRAHLTAGDRARHGGAQQVHRAVHAHQAIPTWPVHLADHAGADRWRRDAIGQPMHDPRPVLYRIDHLERRAIVEQQSAPIAGLAAALAVEDCAIEADPALKAGRDLRPHSASRRRPRETAPRSC